MSKSKRRLYRPVEVALQTEILGKYTYIVPFRPFDCSSYFILSQSPVRKGSVYCFSTQNSNSASIPIKPVWPSLWTGLWSSGELGRGTPFLSLSLLFFPQTESLLTGYIWAIHGIPLKGFDINEVALCFPKKRFVSLFDIIYCLFKGPSII